MKVFISYATEDAPRAESIYQEIDSAGATAFKWGRTETVGKPTWPQILEWINQADVFVVLISRHALESYPVRDEIDQAAYSYSNRRKPEKIVPAILERNAVPPVVIERFARIDCLEFESGLTRLLAQLGLERRRTHASASSRSTRSLLDPGPLFGAYKKEHPEPRPENLWSREAERIVGDYNLLHRTDNPASRKATLDSLLAESAVSWKAGRRRGRERPHPGLLAAHPPAEKVLPNDPLAGLGELGAPMLNGSSSLEGFHLKWTSFDFGCQYVLQRAGTATFADARTIFEGRGRSYDDTDTEAHILDQFYRVKCVRDSAESPWSNVVSSRWQP